MRTPAQNIRCKVGYFRDLGCAAVACDQRLRCRARHILYLCLCRGRTSLEAQQLAFTGPLSVEADAPAVRATPPQVTPRPSPARSPTPQVAKRGVTPAMDFSGLEPPRTAAAPEKLPTANAAPAIKAAKPVARAADDQVSRRRHIRRTLCLLMSCVCPGNN